jgi:glutathione S-transferase
LPPIFDYLETSIAGPGFFVGNSLTLADISVTSLLAEFELIVGKLDDSRWPRLTRYYDEVSSLRRIVADLQVCRDMLKSSLPEVIGLSLTG